MLIVHLCEFTIQEITTKTYEKARPLGAAIGTVGNFKVTAVFPHRLPEQVKLGMKLLFNGDIIRTDKNELEIVVHPGSVSIFADRKENDELWEADEEEI